ncbi:methylated-DNA--[protein]-cysteine S-methyltransferase [Psychromonas sp. MME2]|uniref:methylated-DNA--[protein]-cysteine S-methyltransferase n=1 Tax=unclassified Psychromonas TaxID=2614957 RepID=UPI00339BF45C
MYFDYIETPIGLIKCHASELGITEVEFSASRIGECNANQHTELCLIQLAEYFSGVRKTFDLPLAPHGSHFQKTVWLCLAKIPYGQLLSYADIARMINNPKASQAVGGANAKNPLAIIIPCHRVIGCNGKLTGYAGGLHRKHWLLEHEGITINGLADQQKIAIEDYRYCVS